MNIQEYIDSGIIATYVLGLASEAEQREFEELCTRYPELIKAKRSFELTLEDELMKEAVPLPGSIKEKVFSSLNNPGAYSMHLPEKSYKPPLLKMNVWKFAAVAFVLLLMASIYFAYLLGVKYQKLQAENVSLKSRVNNLVYTNPIMAIDPIVQKPSVKWSAMVEPKDSSHCMAHIYWDSISEKTFLLVGNIPPPVSNKQFQLWALQNNHAINLGTFDIKKQGQLIPMKNVHKAKTFIITIVQKGNSSAPSSSDAMYAFGKF